MTPAEELRAATAKLRETAKAATPGPWRRPLDVRNKAVVVADLPEGEQGMHISGYDRLGNRDQVGVVQLNTWSDGTFMRKRGGRDLEWIALVHPGLAEPLAAWLEREAAYVERTESRGFGLPADPQAIAVARVINGGAA